MRIESSELQSLVLRVAREHYGKRRFHRRPLMCRVEKAVRARGLWTDEDNKLSGSAGMKSKGLAAIDWAISNLKDNGLTRVGHDLWEVTSA